ncbi:MAG: YbaB/EbfC family nucleoid-associated protein [Rickettsia sp.]|nr:YbaB/EbfC family nucleoid-associated protein [Rickettsia sp.]
MNLGSFFKQGLDLKEKFSNLQENFQKKIFEGQAGAGLISVKIKGNKEILSIEISDTVLSKEEKPVLVDLLIAAINNAQGKLDKEYKEYFGNTIGDIPGLNNFTIPNLK